MTISENIQMHYSQPQGFVPHVEVAAAYVEVEGEILFLQRADEEKGQWGVPAGKIETGETPQKALIRELYEETGIIVDPSLRADSIGKLYFRKPEVDFIYHMYHVKLSEKPQVRISEEHLDSGWFAPAEVPRLPLMGGALEAYHCFQDRRRSKKRGNTNVNVYLILKRGDDVLLLLRENTGYCDGCYGLVSGHVEDGESATEGLRREAMEEAGIDIDLSHLRFVHCLHRQTGRLNIDLFFECGQWKGEIVNREPHKCRELKFFPLNSLPPNTIDYVADILALSAKGHRYSECGYSL